MPLIKAGRLMEDRYARILDEAPVPESGCVLLPAVRYLADRAELAAHSGSIGVIWPNNRNITELAPYVDRLTLVALVFPNFKDGRAYSQARILRGRLGYRGELRATGEVLRDQYLFMLRAGFDSFEVKKETDVPFFSAAHARYTVFYQPAEDGSIPVRRGRNARIANARELAPAAR